MVGIARDAESFTSGPEGNEIATPRRKCPSDLRELNQKVLHRYVQNEELTESGALISLISDAALVGSDPGIRAEVFADVEISAGWKDADDKAQQRQHQI